MTAVDDEKSIVDGFIEWCKTQGCTWHAHLNLEYVPGAGAGAKATADISKGEVLLTVPADLRICRDDEASTSMERDASTKSGGQSADEIEAEAVISRLARQIDCIAESKWAPYILQAQKCGSEVGWTLPGPVLKAVSGSDWDLTLMAQHIKCRRVPDGIGEKSYREACKLYFSRAMTDPWREKAMIPLADMLNHNPNSSHTWCRTQSTRKILVLTAGREVKAGEEICINYGYKGNAELFVKYGFVIPKNPSTAFHFDVSHFTNAKTQLAVEAKHVERPINRRVYELSVMPGTLPKNLLRDVREAVCVNVQNDSNSNGPENDSEDNSEKKKSGFQFVYHGELSFDSERDPDFWHVPGEDEIGNPISVQSELAILLEPMIEYVTKCQTNRRNAQDGNSESVLDHLCNKTMDKNITPQLVNVQKVLRQQRCDAFEELLKTLTFLRDRIRKIHKIDSA